MKITIVDGNLPTAQKQHFTNDLSLKLKSRGHEVFLFKISEKKVNYCNGCWTCWVKTPGRCVHHDDMPGLYRSYLQADLVLHYSPLIMGFVSSLLKKVNDRSIPLVHPYGELVQGECHHLARYDAYPLMGLIVDPDDADEEDLRITRILYERMALNLKTRLSLFSDTLRPMNELISEIEDQASEMKLQSSPRKVQQTVP